MGNKYIIEIPDDKVSDFLVENNTHLFIPYSIAGYKRKCDTRLSITPYTEPDLELIKQKAHDNGYSEGYQDGYCKGMNDYLQKPEVKEELDRAYAHGYSDAESKFSEIRKEAYEQGYHAGYAKYLNKSYEDGLNDAWDAARKIVLGDINIIVSVFDTASRSIIIRDLTAAEVIEKLKAYEQEQEEIKIGDEVIYNGHRCVVITPETSEKYGSVMDAEGGRHGFENGEVEKTGRSFPEIAAVLEKMREGQDE